MVYDTFEEQLKRAISAINSINDEKKEKWLCKIIEILKNERYVLIEANAPFEKKYAIQAIAYTYSYLSFFDVFNKINLKDCPFNIDVEPKEIDELLDMYCV
jgi:flagellin-specific chaperone FliS